MKKEKIIRLVAAILICQMAGFIGAVFTVDSIPTWYATIEKPSFNPPNWIFAPVWTTLYLLMGVALYLIWDKGFRKKEVKTALLVFSIQLILNALWSILFFGLRNPLYGLIEIIVLWITILASIILFYKIDKRAALLLIPYILWVSFAAILNYSIWNLN